MADLKEKYIHFPHELIIKEWKYEFENISK